MLRAAAPNVDDNENQKEPFESIHTHIWGEIRVYVCTEYSQTVCTTLS